MTAEISKRVGYIMFATLALLFAGSTAVMAQAKKGTARPMIITFVDDYVSAPDEEESDEFMGPIYNAWQKYKKNQVQDEGTEVIVDTRNGYMYYRHTYPDDEGVIVFEVCYWNCSDGKHKLVAYNAKSFHAGQSLPGQYDGLLFSLYDNATGKMKVWDTRMWAST